MITQRNYSILPVALHIAIVAAAVLAGSGIGRAQDAKPAEQKKNWETIANVGITLTRGNSRNFLSSAGLNSARKWPENEIFLGANAGYGETTTRQPGPDVQNTTEQYVKGFGQYNHLFGERFYSGLRLDGLYDKVAGIHYRFTASPTGGYYFIKH